MNTTIVFNCTMYDYDNMNCEYDNDDVLEIIESLEIDTTRIMELS